MLKALKVSTAEGRSSRMVTASAALMRVLTLCMTKFVPFHDYRRPTTVLAYSGQVAGTGVLPEAGMQGTFRPATMPAVLVAWRWESVK